MLQNVNPKLDLTGNLILELQNYPIYQIQNIRSQGKMQCIMSSDSYGARVLNSWMIWTDAPLCTSPYRGTWMRSTSSVYLLFCIVRHYGSLRGAGT